MICRARRKASVPSGPTPAIDPRREQQFRERESNNRIHRKGPGRRGLNQQEQANNDRRSKICARVEHVSGDQCVHRMSILVRTKGKIQAAVDIRLMNLTYNMRRLQFLLRPQPACSVG